MTRAAFVADRMRAACRARCRLRWIPLLTALLLTALAGPAAPQSWAGSDSSGAPAFLKLTVDSVTPNTVTTGSDSVLTVTGTVTNIGDRVVDDIAVRLQRAPAIVEPAGLRSSLQLDQVDYTLTVPFQDVSERLSPGQRKKFTLRVGIRPGTHAAVGGAPVTASLNITEPGVYPLLLNVNGQPAYGGQAHLDDARFLLPVLGLPPLPTGPEATSADAQPVPAATDAPVATTLLWPLADRPRLVAGIPGAVNGTAMLTDDELAGELAAGGRLDQLLAAVEAVAHPDGTQVGSDPSAAICLAIDPDLLITVSAMTQGYRVLASPSDPAGPTQDGTGAAAAKAWLDRLRALSPGLCTVALPFAQVDPAALTAIHDPALTDRALNSPAGIVDSILSVKSVRGVALPDSGSVDGATATLLNAHHFGTAVLADNAVTQGIAPGTAGGHGTGHSVHSTASGSSESDAATPEMVRIPDNAPAPPTSGAAAPAASVDPGLKVATFDIWSATALAAVGSNPPTPAFTPNRVRYDVANDSRPARLQDALGAMSWLALNRHTDRPRSLLLIPPQQWSADRDEATALLDQLSVLLHAGLATPRSLPDLLALSPDPRPFEADYLPDAAAEAVPPQFIGPVEQQQHRIGDLMSALVQVPEQQPTPQAFLNPLRDDLIRVLSLSDRMPSDRMPSDRDASETQADSAAQRRMDQTTRTLDRLYHSVTVLPPGGVYTLASEQSPLLLVARNDLPVAIRIRLDVHAPAETKITDIGEQQLPAEGTRSFQIPTKVSDSRNLRIPISLTTPAGIALGNATSVSVRSNAYGPALEIITACAGALLLVLAGRRLWRRFRGQPDPADEGLDPGKRRRVNRYQWAKFRVLQRQEVTVSDEQGSSISATAAWEARSVTPMASGPARGDR
jgi:hypothetical protein